MAQIYGLEVDDVTPADREAVRRAGAEDARRSRTAAGLPEHIKDPAAVADTDAEPPALPRRKADPSRPRPGRV